MAETCEETLNVIQNSDTGTARLRGTWFGGAVTYVSELATSVGASLIGFVQAGAEPVQRSVQDKQRDIIDAADFIPVPGASDASDKAGVQKAIELAASQGGGRVRVRKPIRTVWDFSELTIPSNVIIEDERYIDTGGLAFHGSGGDAEICVRGTSTIDGEGPAFTAINNNQTGTRTTSFVGRYGPGAGGNVTAMLRFGALNNSGAWTKAVDLLTEFSDGFRSSIRSLGGATIFNPGGLGKNIDPANATAEGYTVIVNKRADAGGGYQFGVRNGAVEIPQELHVQGENTPIRMQDAAGNNKWTILTDYPSAGQLTVFDHAAGLNRLVIASGATGYISLTGPVMMTPVALEAAPPLSLFVDSSNGKLTFKDASGNSNPLY